MIVHVVQLHQSLVVIHRRLSINQLSIDIHHYRQALDLHNE
jgi:hypothetical protein